MARTADNSSIPEEAVPFKERIKDADVRAAFNTAFDPTLQAKDRPSHVTSDHHGRFALAGGGSVVIDTNGGVSRLILSSEVNGDLPRRLRRQALLLQGQKIPGSDDLTSSAHVLPLDRAVPIKEDTPYGPKVTVVYPGEVTENGGFVVPAIEVSRRGTVPREYHLPVREMFRINAITGDPVPRAKADTQLTRAAVAASEPYTRAAISGTIFRPVIR